MLYPSFVYIIYIDVYFDLCIYTNDHTNTYTHVYLTKTFLFYSFVYSTHFDFFYLIQSFMSTSPLLFYMRLPFKLSDVSYLIKNTIVFNVSTRISLYFQFSLFLFKSLKVTPLWFFLEIGIRIYSFGKDLFSQSHDLRLVENSFSIRFW